MERSHLKGLHKKRFLRFASAIVEMTSIKIDIKNINKPLWDFLISIKTLKQVQGDNSDYFQYPESSSGRASLRSLELPTFI